MTGTSLSATTNETSQVDATDKADAKRCEKTTKEIREISDDGKEVVITETHERCVETK